LVLDRRINLIPPFVNLIPYEFNRGMNSIGGLWLDFGCVGVALHSVGKI